MSYPHLFDTGLLEVSEAAKTLFNNHTFDFGRCLVRHGLGDCDNQTPAQLTHNWHALVSGEGVIVSRFCELGQELCFVTNGDHSVTQVYASEEV